MERARLKSSYLLKERFYPTFQPVDTSVDPGDLHPIHDLRAFPMQLIDPRSQTLDNLNVQIENDAAGAAVDASALLLVSDGPVSPVDPRGAFPIRWTGTHTGTAETWGTPHSITFAEDLASGTYEVLHNRYQGATTKFWRFVFSNAKQLGNHGFRPGFTAVNGDTEKYVDWYRPGSLGVLGRFRSDELPKIQTLCDSTAAQSPQGVMWIRKVA